MKKRSIFSFALISLAFIALSIPFHSCEPDDDCDDDCDSCAIVYKPNLYIYPTETLDLTVKVSFPLGGEIINSIPAYGNGWNISVDTSGLIDNAYRYLFYESNQPNIWQTTEGWTIETNSLEEFFTSNMSRYGFSSDEIKDFNKFWIPLLNTFPYYTIYPQTDELIEQVIQLDFSATPKKTLRLYYVIEGANGPSGDIGTPEIEPFERDGYFATEWGVILQ